MLIDTHAHLDHAPDDLIERAKAAGLVHIVAVGQWSEAEGMAAAEHAIRWAAQDRAYFSATSGIHPHDAARATEADFALLRQQCSRPEVVAVGECGLDFHYDRSPREVQREVFVRQIRLARELGKPLVVHTREADLETAEIIEAELGPDGGVIHCFTSDWTAARRYLDYGMSLSFSGVVTFKNAEAVRDAAARAPFDRILVETDCPYLAPIPHRGKKNEPAFVALTAMKLAEIRGVPLDQIERTTTDNARRVLRLPAESH
ncbi:MAG TPA: TatD family hydrolase [Myxococcales bacterium]|jgi:TatD DNase family protein